MTDYPIFKKAPITEALLDIRTILPEETSLEKLASFHDLIKDRFPQKEEKILLTHSFKVSPGNPPISDTSGSRIDGYRFRSLETNKIVQARLDGFTFNKLKPYENWDVFCKEAKELWMMYLELAQPLKVTRIAVRYINRIEVPLPIKDFKEYILNAPDISPELPQALSHFFMRVVIPYQEVEANAVITETMDEQINPQQLPIIFDIDVFKERIYKIDASDIWVDLEKLRDLKNEIFFNSLTDIAKEMFK